MDDALAGAGELHAAILNEVRSALDDECAASRLRGRMDELEERLRRIERRAEGKREAALHAMIEAGLECIEASPLGITVRHAPPILVITDESAIPDAYRVARPAWLDYEAIRATLKAGGEVPGATLAEPERYLSVRTT